MIHALPLPLQATPSPQPYTQYTTAASMHAMAGGLPDPYYCLPAGLYINSTVLTTLQPTSPYLLEQEAACRAACTAEPACELYVLLAPTTPDQAGGETSGCQLRQHAFSSVVHPVAADVPLKTCFRTPMRYADFSCWDGVRLDGAVLAWLEPVDQALALRNQSSTASGSTPGSVRLPPLEMLAPAMVRSVQAGNFSAFDPSACARACSLHPYCTHYTLRTAPAGACVLYGASWQLLSNATAQYGVDGSVLQTCMHLPNMARVLRHGSPPDVPSQQTVTGVAGAAAAVALSDPGYLCLPPGSLIRARVLQTMYYTVPDTGGSAWWGNAATSCAGACSTSAPCQGFHMHPNGTCLLLDRLFTGSWGSNAVQDALAGSGAWTSVDHASGTGVAVSGAVGPLPPAVTLTASPSLEQACIRTYMQGQAARPPPPPAAPPNPFPPPPSPSPPPVRGLCAPFTLVCVGGQGGGALRRLLPVPSRQHSKSKSARFLCRPLSKPPSLAALVAKRVAGVPCLVDRLRYCFG